MDAYCWLHATVHLDSNLLRKLNTIPRIRTPCRGFPEVNNDVDGTDTLYYQWVPFFLLLQVRNKQHNNEMFSYCKLISKIFAYMLCIPPNHTVAHL